MLIPSQFISSGKDVFAFLYHVGVDFGRTVYKFRIPNKLRPDRTDETPTPEEQSVIDQAISALNSAVEQTAQDVIDADASAQSASESAEQAQESARTAGLYSDTAQTYANSAEISADSASASATASAQSANQSAQIKADVEDLVDDAQASASASAQSATASANSASQASASATSAIQASSNASDMALSAQTYSEIAQNHATHAGQSAQTASTKATESAQSATNAQTYASQAESAKTASQTAQGLAEGARDDAIDAKTDAESARDEAQNIVDGISGKVDQIDSNTERIESLEDDRYKPYPTDTASGAIASFVDGADDIPLKSLIVNIDPVQDTSSGDPSPTNICPISGWTGANVWADGKNLLDPTLLKDQAGWNAIKIYAPVGTRLTMSTNSPNASSADGLPCYFKRPGEGNGSGTIVNRSHPTTKIVPNEGYVEIHQRNHSGTVSFADFQWQIEIGVTATDYEPYNGTTIPINWQTEAGTVYGGRLDVLSGKLTVYPYYAFYNGEALTGRWISDRDVYAVGTTPTIGAQVVDMSGTGTEVQLEANEIASLFGANNLWADTGDVSCEYRADTKLYIERLTAPDSVDMIADANITSGQYFMVGNSLYKATANIASGASVIVGTNAIRKSLSEALNEINS